MLLSGFANPSPSARYGYRGYRWAPTIRSGILIDNLYHQSATQGDSGIDLRL